MKESIVPIAFPNRTPQPDGLTILAADIGGTKADMALFEIRNEEFHIVRQKKYAVSEWPSFDDILVDFGLEPKPDRLSIAIAGPVTDGVVKMTNFNWVIDSHKLAEKFGFAEVFLLNDLEANAYGLAALEEKDFLTIYAGKNKAGKNAALISPGTGLGEAGLFFNGRAYQPFATEGGHTDFGPHNEFEVSLYRFLQRKFGHVSWERIVSGPGIYTIFQFLRDIRGWDEPDWLREKIKTEDPAAVISKAAEKECAICQRTMELFITYLAEEAANVALQLNAKGGIFIGGGIIPKIWNERYKKIFLDTFFEVGRLKYLVKEIPVKIILNPKTAMLGTAYYGAYGAVKNMVLE
jgi:glucokinase